MKQQRLSLKVGAPSGQRSRLTRRITKLPGEDNYDPVAVRHVLPHEALAARDEVSKLPVRALPGAHFSHHSSGARSSHGLPQADRRIPK